MTLHIDIFGLFKTQTDHNIKPFVPENQMKCSVFQIFFGAKFDFVSKTDIVVSKVAKNVFKYDTKQIINKMGFCLKG